MIARITRASIAHRGWVLLASLVLALAGVWSIARTPLATCRPRTTRAASRRSSMRELVHEPMKTVFTGSSRMDTPGFSPI